MSEITQLKVLFAERLAAVAVEMFDAVEKTLVKYKEDVNRSYEDKYGPLHLYFAHPDRENRALDPQQSSIPASEEEDEQQQFSLGRRQDLELPGIPGEVHRTTVKEEELEGPEADPDRLIKLTLPCLSSECDHDSKPALPQGFRSRTVEKNKGGHSLITNTTEKNQTQSHGENQETPGQASVTQAFCVVTVESFEDKRSCGFPPEPNPITSEKTWVKKEHSVDSEKTSQFEMPAETASGERRRHRCQECGRFFGMEADLVAHTRQHRGEAPFECLECGKCFKTKLGQALHTRRHTGEKPYQCQECGKCFVRNGHLSLHMRKHTGEKLYSCQECGQGLSHMCRLIDHMRRHKGEKPFQCVECPKRFYRRCELTVHMRTHCEGKPYECSVCGKFFSFPQSLRRHLRTHTVDNHNGSGP